MRRVLVKAYLKPEEKAAAQEQAARIGLTLSEFTRRVVTATRLPAPGNAATVRDLMRVNADLARLGNLLKLALDDDGWRAPGDPGPDVEALIHDIEQSRVTLRRKIEAL